MSNERISQRLRKAILDAEENVSSRLPARLSIKIPTEDWHAVCRIGLESANSIEYYCEQAKKAGRERDEARQEAHTSAVLMAAETAKLIEATVRAEKAEANQDKLLAALIISKRVNDEVLPHFNWGASALDADKIQLLNEAPGIVNAAIRAMRNAP